MSDLLIQIVDEHDKPIRAASKQEPWEKGLKHRIVRIMIEDGNGNVLLQKRSPGKELFPGRWDSSASGHVDMNETYEDAAAREMDEELGLKDSSLRKIGDFYIEDLWNGHHLKVFVHVYALTLSALPELRLSQDEVTEVRWLSKEKLKRLVAEQPEKVSHGLREVVERFYS